VADVGCGDGDIAARIGRLCGASVRGWDVMLRPHTHVPVEQFDGTRLPLADASVDVVTLVDVLHHTEDPSVLLREARRVAKRSVLLKDHRLARPFARSALRLMDWVGNRAHGVVLPYNYWPEARWRAAFREADLEVRSWRTDLGLYPWPASLLFERGLHFVAELAVPGADLSKNPRPDSRARRAGWETDGPGDPTSS
jgi:SAM-dependent methyltransferase